MGAVNIQGLSKQYRAGKEARAAVDALDLRIEPGEFFVLLGPSGCGKTTTLRCIAGLERPDAGRIELADRLVAAPADGVFLPPERRDLGMVFQGYALWPHLTVGENVAYPLQRRRRGYTAREIGQRVQQTLALVGLEGMSERYPTELSGGQQQRVAVARAIVAEPSLLLFDEALSNLDERLRVRLRDDLRRLHRDRGHTAVYVTHDQGEALALADRVAVMRGGRVEQLGTPAQIFLEPRNPFVAEFVGFENFMPAHIEHDQPAGPVLVRPQGSQRALAAVSATPLRRGSDVRLAIRASALVGVPAGQAGEGEHLLGNLRELTYQGDSYRALVDTQGSHLQVTLPLEHWGREAARMPSSVGHPVAIRWQAQHALVLAEPAE